MVVVVSDVIVVVCDVVVVIMEEVEVDNAFGVIEVELVIDIVVIEFVVALTVEAIKMNCFTQIGKQRKKSKSSFVVHYNKNKSILLPDILMFQLDLLIAL